jgi:signal transduction histidine kinase
MIYRIVQELLANALKYAEASEVLIQLSFQENHIHLTVEDNGKGFDTNIAQKSVRVAKYSFQIRLLTRNSIY